MTEALVVTVSTSLILCVVGWYLGAHYERHKQSDLRQDWPNSIEYQQLSLDGKQGSLSLWGWMKERV